MRSINKTIFSSYLFIFSISALAMDPPPKNVGTPSKKRECSSFAGEHSFDVFLPDELAGSDLKRRKLRNEDLEITAKETMTQLSDLQKESAQKEMKVREELAKRQAAELFVQFAQITNLKSYNIFQNMIPAKVSIMMNSGVPNIEIFLLKNLVIATIKMTVELGIMKLAGELDADAEFEEVVFLEENSELTAKLKAVEYLFQYAIQLKELDNYFTPYIKRKLSDETPALEWAGTKLISLMHEKKPQFQYVYEARNIIIRSTYSYQKPKKEKAVVKSTPLVIELTPPKPVSERERERILKRRRLPR